MKLSGMPTRSESPWRTQARAAILAALESGRAAGLTGRELGRHVSRAYPFGERRCWPYAVWRHEAELLVRGVQRPMKRRFKPRPAGGVQLGLFDGLGCVVGR